MDLRSLLIRLCGQVNDARAAVYCFGGPAKDVADAALDAGEDVAELPLRFIAPP